MTDEREEALRPCPVCGTPCPLCNSLASAQPQREPVAWMLEWKAHGKACWWNGDNWTTDSNKAIRFPSEQSAKAVCQFSYGVLPEGVMITEHMWLPSPPAQAVPEDVKRLTRALIRVQAIALRCPGVDTTDQVTGKTYREAIKAALSAAPKPEKQAITHHPSLEELREFYRKG